MATRAIEADTRELVEELRRGVAGEVRFDKMTRMLYSTDASIYQIEPVGVVLPKSADDVIAVLETANRHNIPVLPRGGGTSLAGQTVANAIVMDFSRHMRDVLEVNEEEGWVRTQPGIILDELNHKIASSGMFFTPDPSTSSRGNVGGALGNNSCGAHSIIWGKTVDNVESLDVVLSNGDRARFGALDGAQLEAKMRGENLEGDIYRKVFGIGETHRNEILARYPKIQRRVSGYNLDEFVGGSDFNMARFVVGSEGTLVTITEAKLTLVKKPKLRALSVIHFDDLIESMEATVATLEMEPAAVELIGSMIIKQAQSNLAYSRITDFIEGEPEALLVVEVIAESEPELMAKLEAAGGAGEARRAGLRDAASDKAVGPGEGVGCAKGGAGADDERAGRREAAAVRGRYRRRAGEAAAVREAVRRDCAGAWHRGGVLRSCERGLPAYPTAHQLEGLCRCGQDGVHIGRD